MRLISSKINVRDYEPTVNRGKNTRFVAKQIELNIDWNGNEIQQWRADIEWICPIFPDTCYP